MSTDVYNLRPEDTRYALIVLQGKLEQAVDMVLSGESEHPSKDPDEAWAWTRLARFYNMLVAQYTERHEDLPPMMIDDKGLIRFWPEDMAKVIPTEES